MSALTTTGTLAHRRGLSRERVLQLLTEAGLKPTRDSNGHRLLTEQEIQAFDKYREQRGSTRLKAMAAGTKR